MNKDTLKQYIHLKSSKNKEKNKVFERFFNLMKSKVNALKILVLHRMLRVCTSSSDELLSVPVYSCMH